MNDIKRFTEDTEPTGIAEADMSGNGNENQNMDKDHAEEEKHPEAGEAPEQGAEEKPGETAAAYARTEAKLKGELEKASQKDFAELVIGHLIGRCKESESLAADVCQEHKTWEKCYDYIFGQARKKADGARSAAVRNDVVYEWAEDYYRKDDKAEEEKKAREEAERKKRKAEKKLASQQAGTYKEKRETEKAASPNKTPAQKQETPKPKPRKDELDGQMDLFSMMGM